MARRIREGETAGRIARRIVRRETKKAGKSLSSTWPVADDSIHDARKRVKKARAALRLARETFGERLFRRENHALRDAARPLSEIRDAKILVEALDALMADLSRSDRRVASRLRATLLANQVRIRRHSLRRKEDLAPLLGSLESIQDRARHWPEGKGRKAQPRSGVERVYEAGRDAAAAARLEPTVEHLHEWRKQAKYLWHQLQFLGPFRRQGLGRLERQVRALSDRLGEDHDLAVLRQRLARAPVKMARAARDGMTRAIDRRRCALQAKAWVLGAKVYRERPGEFRDRIRRELRTRGSGRRR